MNNNRKVGFSAQMMPDHAYPGTSSLLGDDEPRRFGISRWLVGIALLCIAPLVLLWMGVDFSTHSGPLSALTADHLSPAELGDAAHYALRGSFSHTLLEWTAVCTAVFVGILAFVQFRLTREPSLPIIGMALICAGAMDAFFTFAANSWIESVVDNHNLIPFTWAMCRLFNGTILLIGVGIFAFSGKQRRVIKGNLAIVAISVCFVAAAYFIINICVTSTSLPQSIFPDSVIKRPYDIYPLVPYVLCGLLVYPMYLKRYRSAFAHALLLSAVPNVAAQLYMAFGSFQLHDSYFNIAHGLKTLSYAVPAFGLLVEYVQTYHERRRVEKALRQTNEKLEQRVATRTADLTATNWQLAQEVIQRKEMEGALRESDARIRAIVDNAAIGIITIDEQGKVGAFNTAAEKIFGYSPHEVLGQNVNMLMPSPHHEEHDGYIQRHLETGRGKAVGACREVVGQHKDGYTFPIELHISEVSLGNRRLFTGIVRDLTDIKQARDELEATHKQLVDASRNAGMASVATSVLHNVGNVLNSVNVSASVVAEKVRNSKISGVGKVAQLLRDHTDDLAGFLTEDKRGQQFPNYLEMLAEHLADEQSMIIEDLQSLAKNIDHIKHIVTMQQSYATASGVVEAVSVADLMDDAVKMNAASFDRHEVQLVRQYTTEPIVQVDKHKLLQVLVNLIRNAKHAVVDHNGPDMQITLRITPGNDGYMQIEVSDTGIGIPKENLAKVFTSGFTTKKEGHGFGLHSSAIASKEMGGTLSAHSDGPGTGATFTLELPLQAEETQETRHPQSSKSTQLAEQR